ncbi:hypothetical protein M408DRAFT_331999 [Serendipita vermifera MAFF 305830]|uniref:F-box domain-containing protein n=1 Tax=Serendipita vermifera MAFF 305830 TaxID=933852 RepID=A0A0C2WCG5_SERVB|nr:hypothetical protein M408DRAFT_331999 [Serendipita vermifera MAFF 305830]
MKFENIPVEVFLVIFEFLDARDILRLTAASRFLQSLLELTSTWIVVAGKHMPISDPVNMNVASLRKHVSRCYTFHRAWASEQADSVPTRIAREISIPQKVCMIRILPGCKYVAVVDLHENARFYSVETGAQVGCKVFNLTIDPEILYSLDFVMISHSTALWGLLTADDLQLKNDAKKLCIRAILIHYPKPGSLDPSLRFDQVFEWQLTGSPEMLSVSGSYIAAYSYRSVDDSTPTLYVWNWEQQALIATYSVPWINTDHGGGYAGHPALHITPSSILLIGGRLGVHSIYAETDSESNKTFSRVQHVQSSPEDAKSLRFSSQGRCSRLWWGASRPWHRLLVSPSTWEHAGPRPLRLLSFEVPYLCFYIDNY